ncbi:hypothetical protein C5167_029113 [Papaver somniferum]|nr:hypothetical protein C5167_029113 [Papaver somniferum]
MSGVPIGSGDNGVMVDLVVRKLKIKILKKIKGKFMESRRNIVLYVAKISGCVNDLTMISYFMGFQIMSMEEYEKVLEEERKFLVAVKPGERKVELDKMDGGNLPSGFGEKKEKIMVERRESKSLHG